VDTETIPQAYTSRHVLDAPVWADLLAAGARSSAGTASTWRDIARAAIHQLAERDREYRALQTRYGALLDEYRAHRASSKQRAA
jgi:hypothetical protein